VRRSDALAAACRAGDDYGSAAAGLDHRRYRGLDRMPDAGEIHVDDCVPFVLAEPPRLAVCRQAGVRTDDVDVAELGQAIAYDTVDGLLGADVRFPDHDSLALLLDKPPGLVKISLRRHRVSDVLDIVTDVERDYVRAFTGEANRMRTTLAARRTGNERYFSREAAAHDAAFPRARRT
jgi:hypothetical protein